MIGYVKMLEFCLLQPPETAAQEEACLKELRRMHRLVEKFYRRVEKNEGKAPFSNLDRFAAAHFQDPWSQILSKLVW